MILGSKEEALSSNGSDQKQHMTTLSYVAYISTTKEIPSHTHNTEDGHMDTSPGLLYRIHKEC